MLDIRLYLAQRLSAMVMAPLVIGHLAVIIMAVQGGLDAKEILSRTQGSLWWGSFYGLFVVAVSIHAAIGFRVIVSEYFNLGRTGLNLLTLLSGLLLFGMGARAVAAVVM